MRILLTGLSGSGKTTCRLQLQSMLPHYTFYTRNIEGEASVRYVGSDHDITFNDYGLEVAHQLVASHSNLILTISQYGNVPVSCRLPVDINIRTQCELRMRTQRIMLRGSQLSLTDVEAHTNSEILDLELERSCNYTLITSGDRGETVRQLIAFVDQFKLRPSTWDQSDIPLMKHLYL